MTAEQPGPTSSQRRPPVSWPVTVTFLFIGNAGLWADRTNFGVAIAVWIKQYHWTPAIAGLMLSAFSLGYLVMQPIGGFLSDRLGPRRIFSVSCLGWSVFELLTPLAPTVLWLTGAFRLLLGAFEAPFLPAGSVAVARAVPQTSRRGRYNAITMTGIAVGQFAGAFSAGFIAKGFGVPWIFILSGGFGIVLALLWAGYARGRGEPAPGAHVAGLVESRERAAEPVVPVAKLFTSVSLVALMVSYFALPYATFIFIGWLPTYFNKYLGVKLVLAGVLTSLPFLATAVSGLFVGFLSDHLVHFHLPDALHRKGFIYLGALIYVASILVVTSTRNVGLAVGMIVLANVGLNFFVTPFWIMVTDIAPRQAGTLGGFMNFFGILGATVAPAASGFMASATGAFVLPFQVAAALIAVSAIAVGLLVRVRPISQLVLRPGPALA